MIGEIDCREGLLVAVEKDIYPSISDGMVTVIGLFIDVLKDLIKSRDFIVRLVYSSII